MNKILTFGLFLVSLVFVINLFRKTFDLIKAEKRVSQTQEKLEQVKKENEELKKTRNYYQSEEFLEEQIRNKLGMAKPGEKVLVLPEKFKEDQNNKTEKEEELVNIPNWQKWLALFK